MGGRSHWKCGYCPFGSRQDEFSCEADSVERGSPHLSLRQIIQAGRGSGALASGTFEFDLPFISK